MEPEQKQPDLINKNDEAAEQTLEKNTPINASRKSSSSSSSSEHVLENKTELEPLETPRLDPVSPYSWSMVSASPPPTELIGHCFPNRIPDSAFSAVPSSPAGWSTASNESLFSLHMGNTSFANVDHSKSGELRRLDDWINQGLPTVVEEGSMTSGRVSRVESFDSKGSGAGVEMIAEVGPDDTGVAPLDSSVNLSSNARFSQESRCSDKSFAFPVLVGDGMKMESLGRVADIPEEPHMEEQVVQVSSSATNNNNNNNNNNNKSSSRKKVTGRRWYSRFCCWPRSRRRD